MYQVKRGEFGISEDRVDQQGFQTHYIRLWIIMLRPYFRISDALQTESRCPALRCGKETAFSPGSGEVVL
jgi:hypothetical protein